MKNFAFAPMPVSASAYAAGRIAAREKKPCILVLADEFQLQQAWASLKFFYPGLNPVILPPWDCLPYDRASPSKDVQAKRLLALQAMAGRTAPLVLTTAAAVLSRLPPKSVLRQGIKTIQSGQSENFDALQAFLESDGYMRTGTVREVGEYASRGGIFDIFPPNAERPVRIDFFGGVVERMHYFDPIQQTRLEEVNQITLGLSQEVMLNEESIQRFRGNYRELFGAESMNDPIYEAISAGHRFAGIEHFLPLFYEKSEDIFSYAAGHGWILADGVDTAQREFTSQAQEYYETRRELGAHKKLKDQAPYRPLPFADMYMTQEIFWEKMGGAEDLPALGKLSPKFVEGRAFAKAGLTAKVFEHFKEFTQSSAEQNQKIVVACYSLGSAERIEKILEEYHISAKQIDSADDLAALPHNKIALAILPIERGFVEGDLAVISEQDLLGDRLMRSQRRTKSAENIIQEASSLNQGDFAVHADHGVGRFLRLETVTVQGAAHDCLCLEYAGGDKLFLPVENIELLSRYGDHDAAVVLDKLGGAGWQSRKARVKERLREIADHLMRIAAARQIKQGEVLNVNPADYERFCAKFPYAETDDQLRAIDDVKRDLASGKPMDRLVCGDVGFGKTEVALRAAYIAASNGAQVAVVVPTTLLARQHFHNFTRRFDGFPIRIAQLSRLVGHKDSEQIKADVKDGNVDIIIGTHALLSKQIKFANLGLLIVDEEQHFGVAQKERLKELQANVHILTLTATPIPRTLQMALTGVRDLSIIATAPIDRHAVQTHVMPYDPMLVREAILRERHRGGQAFYVCPRIEDLTDVEKNVRQLIPDIRLAVAHGQMPSSALENTIGDFLAQKYDLLLSTNIIESGLDIPAANTIILHRADMFGLAQLYQLRGRVGRSKVKAYAYLTVPERRIITENAQKRLEVMQTLDHLGAGFTVASHDMDIRGAGNLLGEEQSGHVREVGIELYQQMLQEAVAAAKEGGAEQIATQEFSPQINLGIPVLIPEKYVEDLPTRLSLYRRVGNLREAQEIEQFAVELTDRFGKMPVEVENLLTVMQIKNLCLQAGIEKIDAGPKGAVLSFYQNKFTKPEALIKFIQEQRGSIKIRPDQKLVIMRNWVDARERTSGAKNLAQQIVQIAA